MSRGLNLGMGKKFFCFPKFSERLCGPSSLLRNDRPLASPRGSSTYSVIQCFPFQFPVPSHFLKVIQQLLTSYFSSSFISIPCSLLPFIKVFLKPVPTQDVVNQISLPSFHCTQDIPVLFFLSVILLHFSHDRPKSFSPSFPRITFQNFPGIYNLLSELSTFQYHALLCSKYSISRVSFLNLSSTSW